MLTASPGQTPAPPDLLSAPHPEEVPSARFPPPRGLPITIRALFLKDRTPLIPVAERKPPWGAPCGEGCPRDTALANEI